MLSGAGLGLRRDMIDAFLETADHRPRFVEFAPENWMGMGGYWKRKLEKVVEQYPIINHGLSLSIGSPESLDWEFLKLLKTFFQEIPVEIYSEHLSYSKCDNAHLYDLLPIPFREDSVKHVVSRIRDVQDFLERPLAIENVSYYTPIAAEIDESTFISTIVRESGCNLLLDVNNVYVNAFNHNYDAREFILKLPLDKIVYIHMAGHEQVSPDLIIDTHGQPIIDPVFDLFEWTLERIKPVPVLLERDFNIPEFHELQSELARLQSIMDKKWEHHYVAA